MTEQVQVQAPAVATIFFGRKNGLPNYSNEEFTTFLQVPLVDDNGDSVIGDDKALEALLDTNAAFLKAWVYKQLGTTFDVDQQTGVVFGEVPVAVEKPKKSYGGKGGASKTVRKTDQPATTGTDKDELWVRLAGAEQKTAKSGSVYFKCQDGEAVYDNRDNKRSDSAPDFKFADSDEALWLDGAPEWFAGPGKGI